MNGFNDQNNLPNVDWSVTRIDPTSGAVILIGTDESRRMVIGHLPGRFAAEDESPWCVRLTEESDEAFIGAIREYFLQFGVSMEEFGND